MIKIKRNENEKTALTELILGHKGGKTTVKIIEKLLFRPYNINQIAESLDMNYNTIRYHLDQMCDYKLVNKGDKNYGNLYYINPKLKNNLKEFEQIKKYLNNEK